MKFTPAPLADAWVIEPRVFGDERGFFLESWNARAFADAGITAQFMQDNHSRSAKGILRGLHFQNPGPQGKLVRVVRGAVYDVIVDLRQSSPTFRKWFGIELDARSKRMLWVPRGFAHGFLSLADDTDFLYKCDAPYDAATEHSLAWDDPELAIDWPITGPPLLSAKDAAGKRLAELPLFP